MLPIDKDDLGPLPEVHPRIAIVDQADLEIRQFVHLTRLEKNLTSSELLFILTNLIYGYLAILVKREREDAPH